MCLSSDNKKKRWISEHLSPQYLLGAIISLHGHRFMQDNGLFSVPCRTYFKKNPRSHTGPKEKLHEIYLWLTLEQLSICSKGGQTKQLEIGFVSVRSELPSVHTTLLEWL